MGLYYGDTYTLRGAKKSANKKKLSEGVSFSHLTKKWIVVKENKGSTRSFKPFVVIAQFSSKEEALSHYLKTQEK